jgi:hypothetical protein
MGSPLRSPNGNPPVRVTVVNDPRHGGRMTRVASWLVNVEIPKLVPDHRTAPLRERARNADNRLERTARQLFRRRVNRSPTNPDGHTR